MSKELKNRKGVITTIKGTPKRKIEEDFIGLSLEQREQNTSSEIFFLTMFQFARKYFNG